MPNAAQSTHIAHRPRVVVDPNMPDTSPVSPQLKREPADLEETANRMLEAACGFGRETGIYTERGLRRKMKREAVRLPVLAESAVPEETIDYLVQRQVEELIDVSRLSIRQEIVYRLHVLGLDYRCIAATLKIGRHRAARCLRAAKRRVRAAYREGRYAGWYEVYLSEVRRGKRR